MVRSGAGHKRLVRLARIGGEGGVLKKNKVGRALRPLKPTGKETSGKRLVLGFDGRGSACGEQARWMNEQLEGSLKVRNLHDPRIEEWRRKALREEAPWFRPSSK
jgi:hypothetical protein